MSRNTSSKPNSDSFGAVKKKQRDFDIELNRLLKGSIIRRASVPYACISEQGFLCKLSELTLCVAFSGRVIGWRTKISMPVDENGIVCRSGVVDSSLGIVRDSKMK